MKVAGIDVSSKSIDVILLPLDPQHEPGNIEYRRIELAGDDAIERASLAAEWIPRGTLWDDVVRVAIERPFAAVAGGTHAVMVAHLVIGALIAALPPRLRPPDLIQPRSWRKQNGLPVDASKRDVRDHVLVTVPGLRADLPQDTYDAILIARAARRLELEARTVQEELPV